jgi:hypothetical protein
VHCDESLNVLRKKVNKIKVAIDAGKEDKNSICGVTTTAKQSSVIKPEFDG